MSRIHVVVTFLILALGSSRVLEAQVASSAVVGRITDSSGAVILGVEVQLKNLETNQVYKTVTTETGDYTLVSLPIGTYQLSAAITGFKSEVRTGLQLQVGRTYRIDVQLTVGERVDTIEVTSQAPLLQSETPEFAQVIDNAQILELPLNGRDVVGSLASLAPGITPGRGSRVGGNPIGNYNIRGMRTQDTLVLVDGSMLSQNNGQMTYVQSPDSTEEFEIKTGLYGAEYGNRPGGVISLVTKSGTNTFHGTLFNFLRNNKLDARNFFDRGPRPKFQQNQYGATVGGPISIPGLFSGKDKAWVFFSWQGQRARKFQSFTGTVPTAEQKSGRFSSSIIDPLTGQPFSGNTIPANRISDVAKKFLDLWPLPNTPGALNYTCPSCSLTDDRNQVITKVDFKTSDNDRWSSRFLYDSFPIARPNAIDIFTRIEPLKTWAVNLVNTHTFSPNVVNEFGLHYFQRPYSPGQGKPSKSPKDFNRNLGLPKFPRSQADINNGVLGLSVPGFLPLGDSFWYGVAPIGHYPEIKENLSFNKAAHSVKAGYQWRRNFSYNRFSGSSSIGFAARYSGNAFADFLLGYPISSSLGSDTFWGDLSQNTHSLYIQDDWKATNKLTMNLGVRYEGRGSWKDHRGLSSNFNPATGQIDPPYVFDPNLPSGQTGRYQADVPLVEMAKAVLPRVGLAYRLTPKTVVRSGYGAYGNEPYFAGYWFLGGNPRQNAVTENYFSALTVPTLSLSDPFSPSAQSPLVFSPYGIESPLPMIVVHTWGLSIQREVTPNTSFEIGYQGMRSLHEFTLNHINSPAPGPGPLQARRPYPQYSTISMYMGNGDASYHGMEVKLQRREGSEGLAYLLAYTFSKRIDITSSGGEAISPNVPHRLNRGMGEGSTPGRLSVSSSYRSPFGPGRKYLTDNFLGKILGNWTVLGILTLQAGDYITATMPADSLNVGSTASFRPDVLRDPNISERTRERWFDTSAFATPPPFTYGNAGRSIIQAPGVFNLDVGLLRDFRLHERLTLQFRFEAFNSTNHTNFRDPGTTFGTPSFGVIGSAFESRDLQFGLKILF